MANGLSVHGFFEKRFRVDRLQGNGILRVGGANTWRFSCRHLDFFLDRTSGEDGARNCRSRERDLVSTEGQLGAADSGRVVHAASDQGCRNSERGV